MNFVIDMKAKAISAPKRLVLPEGTEKRIIRAARIIMDERIAASVTLLGKAADILKTAKTEGVDLSGINIVHPGSDPNLSKYAEVYHELRKKKGITSEQAKIDIADTMRWGAMMVHLGDADALVGGAERQTSDVLRAGLSIIGTVSGLKTASSCFVMTGMDPKFGANGSMIFSDCAVVPNPTPEQLADITEGAAHSCREFINTKPVAALLSFSTRGSANHNDVTKIQNTISILKGRKTDFLFDGELQADAALIPSVMDQKAPGSSIKGKVNILIFPNLDAGNISYMLVQRLAKAQAYGPFLQGFAKPISNLSRSASVDDIVISCAVTLARAKN